MLQVPPPETRVQITVNTVNTGNKEKKRESRLLSASSYVCVYCYIHLHNLINNCCLNIKNKAFKILFHFLLLKLFYIVSFSKSIQAQILHTARQSNVIVTYINHKYIRILKLFNIVMHLCNLYSTYSI